jgi:1,4-dihydroxy-2-naphthoate octaprenyltransferase
MATRRHIWVHLMLYPGHTLPTAAVPILVAGGLALHDSVFRFWPLATAFLCSWMVHCGGVFTDVYKLITRWPNLREHPELDDALATGVLRLPTLRLATAAWFVLALVPGIYLLRVVGPVAIGLGLAGIAAAAWYAAGKPSMAELGLADPVFFVMFGVVAVAAAYYVQARALPVAALLAGIPSAALVNNVLVIDDLRDVEFDRRKGWRTTAVRFGIATSRREHLAQSLIAYGGTAVLALAIGPWLLLPLLTLPLAVAAELAVWTAPRREALIPWTPRSAFIAMAHAALVCAGLALA